MEIPLLGAITLIALGLAIGFWVGAGAPTAYDNFAQRWTQLQEREQNLRKQLGKPSRNCNDSCIKQYRDDLSRVRKARDIEETEILNSFSKFFVPQILLMVAIFVGWIVALGAVKPYPWAINTYQCPSYLFLVLGSTLLLLGPWWSAYIYSHEAFGRDQVLLQNFENKYFGLFGLTGAFAASYFVMAVIKLGKMSDHNKSAMYFGVFMGFMVVVLSVGAFLQKVLFIEDFLKIIMIGMYLISLTYILLSHRRENIWIALCIGTLIFFPNLFFGVIVSLQAFDALNAVEVHFMYKLLLGAGISTALTLISFAALQHYFSKPVSL